MATYASSTTYFDLGDWLGTERVRTTAAGVKCETVTSLAFGDGQAVTGSCGDPSPLHFTGKQRDTESGLDNLGARYNSSSMGRFMTPDPSADGVSVADPQSWNLYSYVRNRPLQFADMNGNWATYVHEQITTFALTGYVSAGELKQLIAQQYAMDKDQAAEHQFMHAMSNGQSSPPQASQDASAMMWNYVATSVNGANATLNAAGGFISTSLEWLGDAIHTLQDYTSPVHTSASGEALPWNGVGAFGIPGLTHWAQESAPNRDWTRIGFAIRLTMAAFMEANPALAKSRGLTDATFKAQSDQRISQYVGWFYSQPVESNQPHWQSGAARLCALGNHAACF